jgi:hypothetical protein
VIDTPFGKIVKNLMDEKVKFGVSSRGLGSLKDDNGVNVVCEDYMLITPADIVSDPSGPNCFVTAITETREWVFGENGVLHEKEIASTMRIVDTISKKNGVNEASLLKIFDEIIGKISSKK